MELRESVLSAFDEVLDKMAFLFLDEPEEDLEDQPAYTHVVRVTFAGPLSGTLTLFLTEVSALQITRNLMGLGDADPVDATLVQDAVKEFTNMLTGRSMTLLNPGDRCDLDIPTLLEAAATTPDRSGVEQISGMLEEQPVQIHVQFAN